MKTLKVLALLLLTASCGLSFGQVKIAPNQPPASGYFTLPNAFHEISWVISGGATNKVNISATAPVVLTCWPASTQTDPQHCVNATPVVGVKAGPATGHATWDTSNPAAYHIVSTNSFTVTATSVDDATKVSPAVILIGGSSLATETHVYPQYMQLYANQPETIRCSVENNADYRCSWTISGTGCSIGKTSEIATELTHSGGAGTCIVTAASKADTSKTATSQVGFVAASAPMSVTPNLTRPLPCQPDPDYTYASQYDVGPSKTYAQLTALPAPGNSQLIRIFNEDTGNTPSTATTYHNNYQVKGSHVRVCGVANAAGVLPTLDGTNSTSHPNMDAPGGRGSATYGVLTVYPGNGVGLTDLVISGLKVTNSIAGGAYTAPDGSSQNRNIEDYGACSAVRIQTAWRFVFAGNDIENSALGLTAQDNPGFGFSDVTRDGVAEYNNFVGNGGAGTDHQIYWETMSGAIQYNHLGSPSANAGGFQIKPRASDLVIDGNVMWDFSSGMTNGQRCIDRVEPQGDGGSAALYSFSDFLGEQYDPTAPNQLVTPDQVISNNDRLQRERWQGNVCSTGGYYPYHYAADHGNDGEQNPGGRLYFIYNSQSTGAFGIVTNINAGGDGAPNPYFNPEIHVKNNILLSGRVPSDPTFAISSSYRDVYYFGKNVFVTNTVQLPPNPGNGSTHGYGLGWGAFTSSWAAGWERQPTTDHQAGVISSNFIFSNTYLINPSTMAGPTEGLGQAVALSGEEAYDLPRYSMNPTTAVLTPRTAYTDIGAMQVSGSPPPATVTSTTAMVTPASFAVGAQAVVGCTTLMSDGTTHTSTSPSFSNNGGHATLSGTNLTGTSAGQGTVSCTAESSPSTPAISYTVTEAAPDPNAVASVAVVISPNSIVVNGVAAVSCVATLNNGNTRACQSGSGFAIGYSLVGGQYASFNAASNVLTAIAAGSGYMTVSAEGKISGQAPFTVRAASSGSGGIVLQNIFVQGVILQ